MIDERIPVWKGRAWHPPCPAAPDGIDEPHPDRTVRSLEEPHVLASDIEAVVRQVLEYDGWCRIAPLSNGETITLTRQAKPDPANRTRDIPNEILDHCKAQGLSLIAQADYDRLKRIEAAAREADARLCDLMNPPDPLNVWNIMRLHQAHDKTRTTLRNALEAR